MRGWTVVLFSLAGTVLLVGGVGVLSVMLISFSDRRYEIGLRKAMGASDREILIQFLLEAAGARRGRRVRRHACRQRASATRSPPSSPTGLVVNPCGLADRLGRSRSSLALVFGLYPAVRASRLSPMEAMR